MKRTVKDTSQAQHIMALRRRARRPDTRPARSGRNNTRRAAIQEGSR